MPLVEAQVEAVLKAEDVAFLHQLYAAKAQLSGGEILHTGGFYGGLKAARRQAAHEKPMAPHLRFALPEENTVFGAWLKILQGKPLPDVKIPLPYVTDSAWLPWIETVADKENATAQTHLQYAVLLAENGMQAQSIQQLKMLRSQKNPWASAVLGALAKRDGRRQDALCFYQEAYALEQNSLDVSFAEEALEALVKAGQYQPAWVLYEKIPPEKRTETELLWAAEAAVKLENWAFLEAAFEKEYACIREGAVGLADVWYEYKARLAAKNAGQVFAPEQIDRTLPLPQKLNFMMFED